MTNTDLQVKHTCCKAIGMWRSNKCGKKAKVQRNSLWYCGIHDPVAVAEKNAKRNAAWRVKYDAENAAQDAQFAAQKEIERRADCYPDLLESLKDVCQAYAWLTHGGCRGWSDKKPLPIYTALNNAKVVITKATKEQA